MVPFRQRNMVVVASIIWIDRMLNISTGGPFIIEAMTIKNTGCNKHIIGFVDHGFPGVQF